MTEPTREVRTLDIKLTREAVEQRAASLALALEARGDIELDAKEASAEFKRRIKQTDEQIEALTHAVRHRSETAEIVCFWRRNDADGTFELYREDDGSLVDTRPQTQTERQTSLFEVGAKRGKKAAAGDAS